MIKKFRAFLEAYEYEADDEHNNYYFTTESGLDYKVIFATDETHPDCVRVDMAVWDDEREWFSFDLTPKGLNLREMFDTIYRIMVAYAEKSPAIFALHPTTETRYRLYKMLFLAKFPLDYEELRTREERYFVVKLRPQ